MVSPFWLCVLYCTVCIRAFVTTHSVKHNPLYLTSLAALNDKDSQGTSVGEKDSSRRALLWQVPLGAIGFYAYGKLAFNALSLSNDPIVYPIAHESRVSATIATALTAAATADVSTKRTLRILEVGLGTEARLIRRGLYDEAMGHLATSKINQLEITGLDIRVPIARKVLDDASTKLEALRKTKGVTIDWNLVASSIEQRNSQFTDGYFDAILCCLTLCSVDNPIAALEEMKRLLRPSGGTLGYIEHIAVNESSGDHRLLAWQQQVLDPFQQRLADNCHLHRNTEELVDQVFQSSSHRYLKQETFYVDTMWPVSCQACGVIQLTT